MKHLNCITCGKEKLLRAQQKPSCRSCSRKGMKFSEEHRRNLSEANKGKTSPNKGKPGWNKGKTLGPYSIEHRKVTSKYPGLSRWTRLVKKRDGYKCTECGYQGTPGKRDVDAHHVLHKVKYPEYATVLFNGVTLCKSCHKEEHNACL